ncbi:hypothetical protein IT411_03225, partial [Candidatus Peregrinibacteria bacterium]|nr:hypothetical protein [Candidatus Peregrinibacteria bacterium]
MDQIKSSLNAQEVADLTKIIEALKVPNVTFSCLNQSINEDDDDESSLKSFSDEVLKIAIERAFSKLAYRLKRAALAAGIKMSCEALVHLLIEVKNVYEENYESCPDFETLLEVDALLINTFIEVTCFSDPETGLISEEYIDHLASRAVLDRASEKEQQQTIGRFISESREQLNLVYADSFAEKIPKSMLR